MYIYSAESYWFFSTIYYREYRKWNDIILAIVCDTLKVDFGYLKKTLKKQDKYKLGLGINMFMKFVISTSLEMQTRVRIKHNCNYRIAMKSKHYKIE